MEDFKKMVLQQSSEVTSPTLTLSGGALELNGCNGGGHVLGTAPVLML